MDTLLAEVLSSIVHSPRKSHTSSIRTCRAGSTDQYHLYGQPLLLLFYYVRRESSPTMSLRDFAPLRIRSDMVQCETYNQSRPDPAKLFSRLLASSAVQSTPLLATFILAKLRTHGSCHISDADLPSVFDRPAVVPPLRTLVYQGKKRLVVTLPISQNVTRSTFVSHLAPYTSSSLLIHLQPPSRTIWIDEYQGFEGECPAPLRASLRV